MKFKIGGKYRHKFYRFDNLQVYLPNLKSIFDFINDAKYLKDIRIELRGNKDQVETPSNEELLSAVKSTLADIEMSIVKSSKEFKGTKEFTAKEILNVFTDKTITVKNEAQSKELDEEKHVDIDDEDWYAFNENYGTDQEKSLVKYISRQQSKIKEQYEDFYLIRNERHFGIYSFDDGMRFEPDFVLFLIPKNSHSLSENNNSQSKNAQDENNNSLNGNKKIQTYQLFIEPKGENLTSADNSRWKNEFLKQIEHGYEIKSIFEDERYCLFGLPLFNEKENYRDFDKKFDDILCHKINKFTCCE